MGSLEIKNLEISKISGRIIDDQIIEYEMMINYNFYNVLPRVDINNGKTRIEFIESNTDQKIHLSRFQVSKTTAENGIVNSRFEIIGLSTDHKIPISQLQVSETIAENGTITLHVSPKYTT